MSRVSRRGVIAGPKGVVRTYAEFDTHIAGLSAGSSGMGSAPLASARRLTGTNMDPGSVLSGSSWNSKLEAAGSNYSGSFRHGLPSQAAFNAIVSAGFNALVTHASTTVGSAAALNRNGYTSFSTAAADLICTEILYWDGTQAQRMTPNTGGGPTPYSF